VLKQHADFFLQVERGTLHVYVCDMGLAKIKVGCSTMTHVSLVGTPCYAAPETFEESAGKSSNVWGFRVAYLELCGGRKAWGAESVITMSYSKDFVKRSTVVFTLEQEICKGCLMFDPKEHKTMEQILVMLHAT